MFKAKVRFAGNNSGVQYRSKLFNRTDFTVKGYQADLHPNPDYFGMLFGRGKIATRWQRVEVAADGTSKVLGEVGDRNQELVSSEWNELTIIAVGNRLIHQINGINTVDVTDNHPAAKQKGILAIQLHVGAPMTIELKDIRLRHLKGAEAAATIKTAIENRKKAPASAPKKKVALAPRNFDGAKWIWHVKPANTAASHLKKTFEVKGGAKEARLDVSCDNGAKIYLNGKHIVTNTNWKQPQLGGRHATPQIRPERTASQATNVVPGNGAFIASLVFNDNAGKEVKIQSDATWEGAAPETDDWKAAVVLANYGDKPWGTSSKARHLLQRLCPRPLLSTKRSPEMRSLCPKDSR